MTYVLLSIPVLAVSFAMFYYWLSKKGKVPFMPSTDNITEIPLQPSTPQQVLSDTTQTQTTPSEPSGALQTPSSRLYALAKANLERHLTLNASVDAEVGCAQAVSWLLLNAGYDIPSGGISSVAALTDWMLKHGFVEETGHQKGYIITGRSNTDAHIGVCGDPWIMSNSSYTDSKLGLVKGKWQGNYHYPGWMITFPSTRYFRPV